jgi:hypothetical protein
MRDMGMLSVRAPSVDGWHLAGERLWNRRGRLSCLTGYRA